MHLKCPRTLIVLSLLTMSLAGKILAADGGAGGDQRKLDPRLPKYFAAKEQHARALVKQLHLEVAPEVWSYFEAGKHEDWSTVLRLYQVLRRRSGQYDGTSSDAIVHTPVWQTVNETYGAYEAFAK